MTSIAVTAALKGRSEHVEQSATCEWFWYQYPQYRGCLFAIPNGGERNAVVAAKLKKEGVVAGVSDLFLMVTRPGHAGLFIEMKAKNGRLQPNQSDFQDRARQQGYKADVCYGFEEARAVIQEYLG